MISPPNNTIDLDGGLKAKSANCSDVIFPNVLPDSYQSPEAQEIQNAAQHQKSAETRNHEINKSEKLKSNS